MDKVQTYMVVWLAIQLFVAGLVHGKDKPSGTYSAWSFIISTLIELPMIGRVAGWW